MYRVTISSQVCSSIGKFVTSIGQLISSTVVGDQCTNPLEYTINGASHNFSSGSLLTKRRNWRFLTTFKCLKYPNICWLLKATWHFRISELLKMAFPSTSHRSEYLYCLLHVVGYTLTNMWHLESICKWKGTQVDLNRHSHWNSIPERDLSIALRR